MEAKYINAFLEGLLQIFDEVASVKLNHLGTKLKTTSKIDKNVITIVGITGDLKGVVNINMNSDFAMKIASNMMGGMSVESFDEISKSAISELLNIIMGNVSTKLSKMGVSIDITPPTMLTGDNIDLKTLDIPLISVLYEYEGKPIDFDISIK